MLREGRVEQRLQDLQEGLLDEPVEHRRDAELALAAAALGDRQPSHRLRLVASREQLLAEPRPVHAQVGGSSLHRHPVDAGTALVLCTRFNAARRFRRSTRRSIRPLASWALVSTGQPTALPHAAAALAASPPGRLVRSGLSSDFCGMASPRSHGRLALLSVRPFASLARLLWPLLTSRSAGLRPASPFRAQGEISPGKSIGLRCTTAGFTSPRLGHEGFAVSARSPCSAPPRIRFLFVGPQLRSPLPSTVLAV